jgi:quercetin dioxygenase-like cupin family protein
MTKLSILAFIIILGISSYTAQANDPGQEKVTPLIQQALPEFAGHKVQFITVEYLPGQSTPPHEHAGSVIAYVLEGSFTSQLEGQKPVTYHKGQYWYEPPHTGHVMAKNASKTKPAKLLVWLILGDNDPVKLPFEPVRK